MRGRATSRRNNPIPKEEPRVNIRTLTSLGPIAVMLAVMGCGAGSDGKGTGGSGATGTGGTPGTGGTNGVASTLLVDNDYSANNQAPTDVNATPTASDNLFPSLLQHE